MGFLRFFIKQKILVNLVAIVVTAAGIIMFATSPKESLPEIKIGVIQVTTLYQGANPVEVENLVTDPLEDAVKNLSGIKASSSLSGEGVSVIVLELYENVKDTGRVLDDVKAAVTRARRAMPDDVQDSDIAEVSTEEFPVIQVSVSGNKEYAKLYAAAGDLEEDLLDIPGVSSVSKLGFLDKVVWVDVRGDALARYEMTLMEIINALRDRNISVPAGYDSFVGREVSIRVLAELKNSVDVKNVIIRSNYTGKKVQVSNLASVREGFKDEEYRTRINNSRGIVFTILKRQGRDSIRIVKEVSIRALKIFLPGFSSHCCSVWVVFSHS